MSSAYEDVVVRASSMTDCFRLTGVPVPNNPDKNIKCPMHDDSTPSFHIQKSGKGWKCFGGCGEGSMVAFLVKMGIAPTPQAALFMLGDLHHVPREDGRGAPFPQRRKPVTAQPFVPLPPEKREVASPESRQRLREELKGLRGLLTPQGERGADYLRSRGIEPDAGDVSRVKYHPDWLRHGPAVVVPVVDECDRVIAAQGRYLHASAAPKARSLGPIGSGVYATPGALQASNVAIAEAPIDALSLAVCGLPAIALLGCGMKPWLRRMLKFKCIIIATDDDNNAAGDKAADDLRRELTLSSIVRFPFPPKRNGVTKQDVNDLLQRDPDALRQCVRTLLLGDAADAERNAADDDILAYALAQCQAVAARHPEEARRMEARFDASVRATAAHAA